MSSIDRQKNYFDSKSVCMLRGVAPLNIWAEGDAPTKKKLRDGRRAAEGIMKKRFRVFPEKTKTNVLIFSKA